VAERHALKDTALKVFVVTNSPIAVPRDPLIERVVVGAGMDEADNWIAERAGSGAIVITAGVPLASRAVKAGAEVIAPNGRAFSADSIGMTLATRNLMDSLRRAIEIWTRSLIAPSAPLPLIRIIRHAAGRLSAGRRRRRLIITG
jgi:uncharacterized protein YaiI (UPF0178 family)